MDEKKFNWGKRIAVALAFVTVCSISMIAGGQYAAKRKRDEQPQAAIENTIITPQQSNGIKLMSATIAPEDYEEYGVAATAESAMTLTATITPANATNKKVDWSVAWVNASSTWATGKTVTDYVTVTTATDGALTATVSCLKAFGEQITVKVASRENATKTASCTVDYVKRVVGWATRFGYLNGDSTMYSSSPLTEIEMSDANLLEQVYSDDFSVEYGTGTVKKDLKKAGLFLRVNEDFLDYINETIGAKFIAFDGQTEWSLYDYAQSSLTLANIIGVEGTNTSLEEDDTNRAVFENFLANHQDSTHYAFSLYILVDNGEWQEKMEQHIKLFLDPSAMTVTVQSVAVSDSGITF